jgi:F-type H+-transporting ATPase subunit epsilon
MEKWLIYLKRLSDYSKFLYNTLMADLHLKIVTPEKIIFDEEVDMVNLTSEEGELGILPHHANLMAKLEPGELRIKKGGKVEVLATGDGFIQVADNTLTILTDLAENVADIDEKAVEDAKKRAEQALEQKLSDEEYAETLAILEKSLAQLRVKRRHRVR